MLYFVNKQHTCNLIVKQGWKIPVDEDSVSYDTMDSWTDASFSKTLRNRTTALAVKSNANGTISWTINLDKAGAPAGSVITEVGKFKNFLQDLKKVKTLGLLKIGLNFQQINKSLRILAAGSS